MSRRVSDKALFIRVAAWAKREEIVLLGDMVTLAPPTVSTKQSITIMTFLMLTMTMMTATTITMRMTPKMIMLTTMMIIMTMMLIIVNDNDNCDAVEYVEDVKDKRLALSTT